MVSLGALLSILAGGCDDEAPEGRAALTGATSAAVTRGSGAALAANARPRPGLSHAGTATRNRAWSCGDFLSAEQAKSLGVANPKDYDPTRSIPSASGGMLMCRPGNMHFSIQDPHAYAQYLKMNPTAVVDNRYGLASFTYGEKHDSVCVQFDEFTLLVDEGATTSKPLLLALLESAKKY